MTLDYRNNGTPLPEDVLNEIFKLTLPSISTGSPACVLTRHQAPMSLTQTCRKWRKIALYSALLWNRIHFKIEADSPPKIYPNIELVEQTFRLSKSAPLHIYGIAPDFLSNPVVDRIYNMLFSSVRRWKHVYLFLPDISFNRLVLGYNNNGGGIAQIPTAELRSLCLTTMVDSTNPYPPHITSSNSSHIFLPVQLWVNASHLQHLALNFSLSPDIGPSPRWKTGLHAASTTFNQLTLLEIGGASNEGLSMKDLYTILKTCALNLVTGRFLAIKPNELVAQR